MHPKLEHFKMRNRDRGLEFKILIKFLIFEWTQNVTFFFVVVTYNVSLTYNWKATGTWGTYTEKSKFYFIFLFCKYVSFYVHSRLD